MKFFAVVLAGVALCAVPAMAEDSKFDGFSLGLGLSLTGASTNIDSPALANLPINSVADLGQTSAVATIDMSYGFSVAPKFVLAVGASYDFGDTDLGTVADPVLRVRGDDHYSIYLQPTYELSDTTAVFGKLGYHAMKGTLDCAICEGGGASYSRDLHGVGVGAGVKTFLNERVYLQIEVQHIEYNAVNTSWMIDQNPNVPVDFDASSNVGLITIGMTF
ncbi:outer membrane beta-barrel protein [Rhodobacter maris]|uniref:Opacity protein-like surface antigen n=1 Tax=Rhodobacter maris TaxID=446682 RepID=A0A285TGE3_9RHOB|nr:outer membrane beta-barrel protein [Rhodobacter maris]SOC21294.1 opacity protein-like surface antigen [Rhodobacter maris]